MEASLKGVFKNGFDSYKKVHGLSYDQHRAAQTIMACQSEELGYEEWICRGDGHVEKEYHSCRHRSCPRCNNGLTHEWLEKIQARLLPCDHYHVIFTLPHELNTLWHYNRAWHTDRLFKAAAETLRQLLSDERYLGAEVGILASLHTWGRTLSFHPHVHMLVTGGGLNPAGQWVSVKKDFLLPVGLIKAKFKGKWLTWLNEAYAAGEIKLPGDWSEKEWKKALTKIARKNWNIRIQGGYRHGRGVANYLSRYIRGGPIKDHRLIEMSNNSISFRYKDYRDGKIKVMELSENNFISRVLSHVPVKGRHHVRYYGLYVPGAQAKRATVRDELGEEHEEVYEADKKERCCPECGHLLFHHISTRGKKSYIKSTRHLGLGGAVQQDVQVDRDSSPVHIRQYIKRTQPDFFGPYGGNLTQR
ncbi:MAG: IS91 family transposase [Candidatus Sedimenticola sp. (ex Thyasira tokunagai)]